jgi:hypothetical protein
MEIVIALGIISVGVLFVFSLNGALARVLRKEASGLTPFNLITCAKMEEIRNFAHTFESGRFKYEELVAEYDGRRYYYDDTGAQVPAELAAIECAVHVSTGEIPAAASGGVYRVIVKTSRKGGDARGDLKPVTMVTLLAPPPPREHLVIAGFLNQVGTGACYKDDFWGDYYGAAFGIRQARAYLEGRGDPNLYPLPYKGEEFFPPPPAPNPAPYPQP